MRTILFSLLFTTSLYGQKTEFTRTVFSEDISFVRVDSSHGSQSTVIEYPNFLVLIDLPIVDKGANVSTNLTQDNPKTERFINFLKASYGKKPVKYVLSTHWHLHSMSGITPMFNQGAILVSTRKNWDYCTQNGLFGKEDTKALESKIKFIDKDTRILEDTDNPISVLYLDETYINKPTDEYLIFYLPKSKCLHASCVCAIADIDFTKRPEFIYNDRVTDLDRAIQSRGLEVSHLFKLTQEYDATKNDYKIPVFGQSYYSEYKRRGKPQAEVVKGYTLYDESFLKSQKDSILHHLIDKKISGGIINGVVYACIKEKSFQKAIHWAQILNILYSGENNYLDTMGEAYYASGDTKMAEQISNRLAILSKSFPNQIKEWANTYRK
jgi:hypothetical protein